MIRLPFLRHSQDIGRWAQDVIEKLNNWLSVAADGRKSDTVTISGGVTSTTISHSDATAASVILVMPTNLEARTKHWFINPSNTVNKSLFVIEHETISVTATFRYVLFN